MSLFGNLIVYLSFFISLYIQVFILITFLEYRLAARRGLPSRAANASPATNPKNLPAVTVIVPCWNEERTLDRTMRSLLGLSYPKDKLNIIVVDDGSTDGTSAVAHRFEKYKQVRLFKKENGGKHSALNFGLARTETPLVGCLDADSFVLPDTLKKIVARFSEKDVMAVTPAVKVYRPKNILELIQKAEYNMGIFNRKMFGMMNAIHVAPGPFTIFRKKVFDTLGGYRSAHNTEDLEIAMRMQNNHYRIENAEDAFVLTVAPRKLRALVKQRTRWITGFLKNAIDYRHMFFKKKYGNVALFTIPAGVLSIVSASILALKFVYEFCKLLANKFIEWSAIHFHFLKSVHFDWFFWNTETVAFLGILLFFAGLIVILIGKKMAEQKQGISREIVYFSLFYAFIAPLWILKSVYNTGLARKTKWR